MLQQKVKEKGFTIVELLIVIVVIAILAAISIVAYNGIQDRARDTSIKSDLSNAAKKIMLHHVDAGRYPAHNATSLEVAGLNTSPDNYYTVSPYNSHVYCISQDGTRYALVAWSHNRTRYYVTYQNSTPQSDTTAPQSGTDTCTPFVGANPWWLWGKSGTSSWL